MSQQTYHSLYKRFYLGLCLLALYGCAGGLSQDLSATYTVQAVNARTLATKIATGLKATTDIRNTQVVATNQAIKAEATTEFSLKNAAQIAAQNQATETVQALQAQLVMALTWPVIITDTFENDANGWPSGEAADEFGTSKWHFAEHKFIWEASAEQSFVWWAVPNAPHTEDFYLKVNAQQTQGAEGSAFGLIFRILDEVNYYTFEVIPSGLFSLYQHSAEGWIELVPWTSSRAILADAPNELVILGVGNQVFAFINEEFIASFANPTLNHGQNGLLVSLFNPNDQATWEFSNFELRVPSTYEITPAPPGGSPQAPEPEITTSP